MDRVRRTDVPALGPLLGDWRGDGDGDGDGSGSAYRRLAAALRGLVRDGRIPPGTRLPAERRLAAALAVSRTTVTAAYGLLRATGHAESHHGSGTYAALPPATRRTPGAGEAGRVPRGAGPVKGVGSGAVSGAQLPTSQAALGAGAAEGLDSVAVSGRRLPASEVSLGAGT
ncbi:GntR family transcriptional regulator, partial [Streptomyces sp. NPDC057403]|uniref:GntR family transcriptional regulator n=1 Tax=Streptomyces sp. NPDC057403 TaxID=3346119 RepID=UPI0036931827